MMAFTSGTTTKGIGPSGGLLEALVNFVTSKQGTDIAAESLGTPDGTETSFSGTLAHVTDIKLVSFEVTYTIGGTEYTAVTSEAGVVTGTDISSGQLNTDGTYSLTFSTAPDNTTDLDGDYTYDYVAGRDWDLLLDQNAKTAAGADTDWGSDTREVVLHNTGLGGQDNVMIGMHEWKVPSEDRFGWSLNGYTSEPLLDNWNSSGADHGKVYQNDDTFCWENHPNLQMFDGTIAYWFYSNKQRIIVEIRCSSDYYNSYLGFGNRFDSYSEYPNPLIVSGTCCGSKPYQDNAAYDDYDGGFTVVRPYDQDDGADDNINVDYVSTLMAVQANGQFQGDIRQMMSVPLDALYGKNFGDYPTKYAINQNKVTDAAADGSYFVMPSYLLLPDGSIMEVDGVKILRKNNVTSEDTRTDSVTGDVWRLFQSGSNTNACAWLGIRED